MCAKAIATTVAHPGNRDRSFRRRQVPLEGVQEPIHVLDVAGMVAGKFDHGDPRQQTGEHVDDARQPRCGGRALSVKVELDTPVEREI